MTASLHILGAAIANVLISFIWFHPRVFGMYWRDVVGFTREQVTLGAKHIPLYTLIALVGALLLAFVMNAFATAWGVVTWFDALGLAFWAWIGFIVPTSLGTILWEQRPVRFYLVNAGYWLVSFTAMALILAL